MSALSPLSGVKRKLDLGAVRSAYDDPKRTVGESDGLDDHRHKPRGGASC